ncbi:agarase [Agaribacterium sp. ZY112]|uniref:agarase n=1 Tax=Agaribacterium sp. ZY112 TaxID=3233574 RepID=UPI0035243E6D
MPYNTYNKLALLALVASLGLSACSSDKSTEPGTPIDTTSNDSYPVVEHILDFDKIDPRFSYSGEDAKSALIDSPSGQGKALKIDFGATEYRPTATITTTEPWNWEQYDEVHIAFDVHNTGKNSIQLYLELTNAGDPEPIHGRRSASIGVGESGTYYGVIKGRFKDLETGLREQPAPWKSDETLLVWRYGDKNMPLDQVTNISFFVRGNVLEKQVVIDNIRLRKNPTYNNSTYLEKLVDRYGQNAQQDYPIKISSDEELKAAADKELAELNQGLMKDRSRFGGWKDGPKYEATGYFRTQKIDGQWWMIDPEGYLFFSHGLANVRMANLSTLTGADFSDDKVRYIDPNETTPEDSLNIVPVAEQYRQSRYVSSDLRHNMFEWLPSYDDDLGEHFGYRRSVLIGPVSSGETYSFYRANLERRYGQTEPESYIRQWEETTLDRMQNWGFTSMGNWVDPAFYPNEKVPYFANGWIIGDYKTLTSGDEVWSPLPDAFDPEFVHRAKVTIDIIAKEIQASPWCVGIFVDNEKSWGRPKGTIQQRYGVIVNALSRAAAESPAKRHFASWLREKYANDIGKLNDAWQTEIASWQVLADGVEFESYNDALIADMSSMLNMISNEYFRVVHDAIAEALPNHLYMGARMASWGMPQETISAAVKYSDVLSFNIYEEGLQKKRWSFLEELDLPTLIGEFHIGSRSDTGVFHPGLTQASSQADRAKMYLDYMKTVVEHPNMVGAHWFQYVDSPITGRAYDGENYNVGFVSVTDIPYPEMVQAAKLLNSGLYPKRYQQGDKK